MELIKAKRAGKRPPVVSEERAEQRDQSDGRACAAARAPIAAAAAQPRRPRNHAQKRATAQKKVRKAG